MKKSTIAGICPISDEQTKALLGLKDRIIKARENLNRKFEMRDALQAKLDGIEAEIEDAAEQLTAPLTPGSEAKVAELTSQRVTIPVRIAALDRLLDRGIQDLREMVTASIPVIGKASAPIIDAANERVVKALAPYFGSMQAQLLAPTSEYVQRVSGAIYVGSASFSGNPDAWAREPLQVIDRLLQGDIPTPNGDCGSGPVASDDGPRVRSRVHGSAGDGGRP
jgi:hypothetical protein